jgi:antitoxin component of RelBE/YafQ-DinJ toxin-antitoxin module
MRKGSLALLAATSLVVASPALAVGLGDLAKVVLGGGSVLKKGKEKCGNSFGLTTKEQLQLAFAQAAAEKALPVSEFLSLDTASKAEAEVASQSPTFCTETKAKKKGLLAKIGKAAKGLAGL